MDLSVLSEPFSKDEVEWRVQRSGRSGGGKPYAMVLCYVTARAIMNRLDAVCGPMNWRDEFRTTEGGTMCGISIRCGDEWVTKWDGSPDTQVEAFKGGLSKAFVRCAVKWGIGRYLYSLPTTFADITDKRSKDGNHIKIDGSSLYWSAPDYDRLMHDLGIQAPAAKGPAAAPEHMQDEDDDCLLYTSPSPRD